MKVSVSVSAASKAGLMLIVLISSNIASAQYPPREECYWECGVEVCNYYEDHCSYECHEICYPILQRPYQMPNGEQSEVKPERPLENLALRNQGVSSSLGKEEGGRIGKVVKMRLENPAYETLRKGKYVLTRGSPPRAFAMFQDCLSASDKRSVSMNIKNPELATQNITQSASANEGGH